MMICMRTMPPYLRLLWDHFQQRGVKNIQVATGQMWVMCRVYSKFTTNVQNNQEHKSLSCSRLIPLKLRLVSFLQPFQPAPACTFATSWFSYVWVSSEWRMNVCLVGREFDQFWWTWWFWMTLECLFLWVENLINLDKLDDSEWRLNVCFCGWRIWSILTNLMILNDACMFVFVDGEFDKFGWTWWTILSVGGESQSVTRILASHCHHSK